MKETATSDIDFSVLMCVYRLDDPVHVDKALESIAEQSVPPDQMVIVEDGPIGDELGRVLDRWGDDLNLKRLRLEENCGLYRALDRGLQSTRCEIVGRMDADDIARPDRFERQLRYFWAGNSVDVVGSWVEEFEDSERDVYGVRAVPSDHEEILKFSRFRCPMNHVSVMYRKKAVNAVGGYCGEASERKRPLGATDRRLKARRHAFAQDVERDYLLWVKLLRAGYRFANIEEPLVRVRGGRELAERRGGLVYLVNDVRLHTRFLTSGHIGVLEWARNILIRSLLRLAPTSIRHVVYRELRLRKIGAKNG